MRRRSRGREGKVQVYVRRCCKHPVHQTQHRRKSRMPPPHHRLCVSSRAQFLVPKADRDFSTRSLNWGNERNDSAVTDSLHPQAGQAAETEGGGLNITGVVGGWGVWPSMWGDPAMWATSVSHLR